ncbi:heme NO-binding domain-containing protein [Vibrio vulnificus]|uniref:heme NO-binding domain-containing protein n=1 Tax=Vibrio vulnificus TaxID=672 RepID=UPI0028791BBE|nr:heme NO-binding domain-containing protein [Vibrio vulnificus]EJT1339446.1 heme NO-binding domain-containing protein [Vibrio vulnificus]ELV8744519.1 heme NO-binding domain-containing protein [Vibrio vulnificus]ELV8753639.1 heme NO-binding domain-containing protein [Vibrio vulnificus]MDS1826553.1 heme NO-binding domain-containing protein [Vibrio vulnificus]
MKGIIFTEFLELVEEKFGLAVLDDILDRANDQGIYTAVGSYDHRKLVSLIVHLSQVTGIPVEQLQEVFGEAVFDNLLASISNRSSLHQCHSTFQFIRHVEEYIHVEVKKLYPDAKPPEFIFIEQDRMKMVFDYKSARCMGHVCLGLMRGCAKHFGEELAIQMETLNPTGSHVRFNVALVKGKQDG